jgi:hypothetical protein
MGAPGHRGRPWLRSPLDPSVEGGGWLTPAPVFPIRILHYPVRTYAQYHRRVEISKAGGRHTGDARALELYAALDDDRLDEVYGEYSLDDSAVADGISRGVLVEDTRVRDAVRSAPDWTANPDLLRERRPLCPPATDDERGELAEDTMGALLRSETIAMERLGSARRENRQLQKKVKRLRRRLRKLKP